MELVYPAVLYIGLMPHGLFPVYYGMSTVVVPCLHSCSGSRVEKSLRVFGISLGSSTRHDFPTVEHILSPIRELLVTIKVCMLVLDP